MPSENDRSTNVTETSGKTGDSERKRLQLEFSKSAFAQLQEIMELSGARTNAEAVRNALRLYKWYLEQKREHYRLQLVRGDSIREVEIVF